MSKTISTGMLDATINGIPIKVKQASSGNYTNVASRSVAYIVMHYTGNSKDTAVNNCTYFQTSGRGASAHFFVDENSIYQSVELRDRAWHVGANSYKHKNCRNTNAIGIEMCCSSNYKISEKTKENAAYLCAHICKLLGITAGQVDTYVLRHWDVTGKSCPAQMTGSNNTEWTAFKSQVKTILSNITVKDTSLYIRVTAADGLNMRSGAGTSYNVLDTLPQGTTVTVTGITDNGWYRITYKNAVGYISSAYTETVVDKQTNSEQEEADMLSEADVRRIIEEVRKEEREKAVSAWAAGTWNAAKEAGIVDGTMPQAPATREQLIQILSKIGLIGK